MRKEAEKTKVLIADPDIGYGHRTFADALEVYAESSLASDVEVNALTLRDDGNSLLTRTALAISEALYQQGGQGGLRTRFYERNFGQSPNSV